MEMIRGLENPLELETIIFDFDGTLAHLNIDFGEMRRQVLLLFPEFGLDPTLMEGTYVLEGIEAAVEVLKAQGRKGRSCWVQLQGGGDPFVDGSRGRKGKLPFGRDSGDLVAIERQGPEAGHYHSQFCPRRRSILAEGHLTYDVLLSREDMGRSRVKPDPAHLREALQILEGTPDTSLMVGDHPLDIRVAKRVGAYSAGVLTGRHQIRDFEEAGADLILESVRELPCLFDRSSLRSKA